MKSLLSLAQSTCLNVKDLFIVNGDYFSSLLQDCVQRAPTRKHFLNTKLVWEGNRNFVELSYWS